MSENQTAATAKPVLTKEEKLAKIDAQIKLLQVKRDDIANDRIPATKAKAAAYVPSVGDAVIATVGRNTATSQAKAVEGTVVAVKFPEVDGEGKAKGAIQVRVRIFAGTFDEQLVTLYPAQLEAVKVEAEVDAESEEAERPLGQLPA